MDYSGFNGALRLLPPSVREGMCTILKQDMDTAEEIRLRAGKVPTVLLPDGEIAVGTRPVVSGDIDALLDIATGASVHTARNSIRQGYITAKGGYRIGLCGTATVTGGVMTGFHALTGATIRIPREIIGVADDITHRLFDGGDFCSTVIISPPGCGKTTLLRDIIRNLASGTKPLRVCVADERGEVAATYNGRAQMNIGNTTDVLDGCPKAQGVMVLLRAMNPQVIAMDEITAPEDIDAIEMAANCGVGLIATAHGSSIDDLQIRPLYRKMTQTGVFRRAIIISKKFGVRSYKVLKREGQQWLNL